MKKITHEARLLLEREAHFRAQTSTYKELALKTGLSANYISNFIGRMVRGLKSNVEVSRETKNPTKEQRTCEY